MSIVIRSATSADLPVLQDVEGRAGRLFLDVGMPEIAEDEPPSLAELEAAVALLVAIDEAGELVGYARIELVGDRPHLEQLSVLPEHGGRGVGTALLDAVVAWARRFGADEVTLTTFRDVPFNAPLYAKRGFTVVPPEEWSPSIRELVAAEAAHGLDPATRVVMRRPTQTGAGPVAQ